MHTEPLFPATLFRAASIALLALSACDETGPRIYTAQAYDPEAACLEPYVPLGLVEADELRADCAATCLRGAQQLYVSTVCSPYPRDVVLETPEESPECAEALASLEAEASCE
jgi:hypothetical protein